MKYWSNKPKLNTLSAAATVKTVKGNKVLTFITSSERADVFLTVEGDIERVLFFAHGKGHSEIQASSAQHIIVGEGNWERDVYHFLKPGGPAPTMRLGITKHRGFGTWSSLPHDFELNTESGFEEIFFYILKGGGQRAIQVGRGVWHDNTPVDGVWTVNNNTFGTVPMGYHPIVGEPGVHVSYIWVYLAKYPRWEKIK